MMRAGKVLLAGAVLSAILLAGVAAAQGGDIQFSRNGDLITISGSTNLAVGDPLIVTVESAGFTPTEKGMPGGFAGAGGTVLVQPTTPLNSFSFDVNVSTFPPGEYLVTVESIETGFRESGQFVLPWTPIPTRTPSAQATTPATISTPHEMPLTTIPAPQVSPTRTPVPGILSIGAIIIADCILLRRR
jgi:hypothetical protein